VYHTVYVNEGTVKMIKGDDIRMSQAARETEIYIMILISVVHLTFNLDRSLAKHDAPQGYGWKPLIFPRWQSRGILWKTNWDRGGRRPRRGVWRIDTMKFLPHSRAGA